MNRNLNWWEAPMEGSVLNFLKAEWKVSDTGSAYWASSYVLVSQEPLAQIGPYLNAMLLEWFSSKIISDDLALIQISHHWLFDMSSEPPDGMKPKLNKKILGFQNCVNYQRWSLWRLCKFWFSSIIFKFLKSDLISIMKLHLDW
jgi:hypothetical protein